jgi:hypothetical protein
VPLLAAQVLAAVLIGALALEFEPRLSIKKPSVDLILFAVVWAVTAVVWAAWPVPPGFWVTGPRPPNFEYYPFSDPIIFDLGSQFALIGRGIFNGMFFDRALYMSFLVYLHMLGGQDYQRLMAIQACIFAVFPALLYLIGRRLHSRAAGLVIAFLAALRGLNGLGASAWIDTAGFKHMLTDFPTAIGVAIYVVLILGWLASPQRRPALLLWAAGVVGLSSLLRPNMLILFALTLAIIVWVYRSRMMSVLGVSSLASLAFLAGVAPWLIFGPSSGSIVALYGRRLRDMVALRYPRPISSAPSPGISPTRPVVRPTAATPATPEQLTAAPPTLPVVPPPNPGVWFGVPQYLHNLLTAALIFPDSPEFLTVKDTVKGGERFWLPRWDGSMSAPAAGMLILNLAALAFGFGIAAERQRWTGLVPLAVFLTYLAANALARTSGGRYLVPADWILLVYFAIGLTEMISLARLFSRRERAVPDLASAAMVAPELRLDWRSAAAVLGSLVVIGALVPLAGVIYPPRYAVSDASALAQGLEPYSSELNFTTIDVSAFLLQDNAMILNGRILYPRFYGQGDGEPARNEPFIERDYPRLALILVGPRGSVPVVLPGRVSEPLPDASDAIVIGCLTRPNGAYLLNAAAIVLTTQHLAFRRQPSAPLACPLPDPVCDNNGNCR